MASKTEPRNQLKQGWAVGESGWHVEMDSNLRYIDNWGLHLSIIDRDLASPPASPADGATYIIAATPSGEWIERTPGDIAMWSNDDNDWRFASPRLGWVAYIEDEEKLIAFKSGGWSAGVAI